MARVWATAISSCWAIRWNLGLEIGAGWIRADYDMYDCPHCGEWRGSDKKDYFGVTKAAVSLIYMIK